VIQYLIEISNILNDNNQVEEDEDPADTLIDIMQDLNMSEKDLQLCHGRSATTTARKIMKHLYPNPDNDCKIKQIDESIVNAVISMQIYLYFFFVFETFRFLQNILEFQIQLIKLRRWTYATQCLITLLCINSKISQMNLLNQIV
jgi:hypothetical protein